MMNILAFCLLKQLQTFLPVQLKKNFFYGIFLAIQNFAIVYIQFYIFVEMSFPLDSLGFAIA